MSVLHSVWIPQVVITQLHSNHNHKPENETLSDCQSHSGWHVNYITCSWKTSMGKPDA